MWSKENKKIINEIVVVEGKTDTSKLKSIFDVNTIETNGLSLSKQKLKEIKKLSETKGIILFLDPDGPGEKIRKIIMNEVPEALNCFITKDDIKSKKKIGIAEASNESIIKAFENIKKFSNKTNSISWEEYIDLDFNSKSKRIFLCNKLRISYCNHKQLFKRLNMLNLTYYEIIKILNK